MATRYNWMADTQPEALAVLNELLRKKTPGEKLEMVLAMAGMVVRGTEENVRRRYPDAGDREVFLRSAAERLGRETVIKVYGWDPESDVRP